MSGDSLNSGWEQTPENFRCGFVSIVGAPNVGKSTLLNRLIGAEIAITTKKPQTTRNRITGIYNSPTEQIVFVDTPGIHKAQSDFNKFIVQEAVRAIKENDLCILVEEALQKLPAAGEPLWRGGNSLEWILKVLAEAAKPTILALNKIDIVQNKNYLLPQISALKEQFEFLAIVPISALKGEGVKELLEVIISHLKPGPRYFPSDIVSDRAERFFVAELIRKQIMLKLHQEIPYSSTVMIENFIEIPQNNLVRISAIIIVEKKNHKMIIIGKGGTKLKEIGQAARMEIEAFLGCKVFLETFVKVVPDWTRKKSLYSEYVNLKD